MKNKIVKTKINFGNQKMFPITSVCKEDIIRAFEGSDLLEHVKERIEKMDNSEMDFLANKMADDYCNQLFWDSLRIIFEDRFLNKSE